MKRLRAGKCLERDLDETDKMHPACSDIQNQRAHSHLDERDRIRHEQELLSRVLGDWYLTEHFAARKLLDYVFHTEKAVPQEGHCSA